jgi:hypothetical protein
MIEIIGVIVGLAGLVLGGVRLFARFQERRENKRLMELGGAQEKLKQHEEADHARARMDGVKPSSQRDTVERLRDAGF